MEHRNRNTAVMLVIAGLFFLLGTMFNYIAVSAVVLIWLGIHKIRADGGSKGYIILVIGTLMLLGNQLSIVLALILISLGYFIIKSRKIHQEGKYSQHQTILDSVRWNKEPWSPKNMSRWSLLGEARIDLSLAIEEEGETTIMLHGIVGDVDIWVPQGYPLAVEANVSIGRIEIGDMKDTGMLNKRSWQSENYSASEHRMKLIASYVVGDIEVKML